MLGTQQILIVTQLDQPQLALKHKKPSPPPCFAVVFISDFQWHAHTILYSGADPVGNEMGG